MKVFFKELPVVKSSGMSFLFPLFFSVFVGGIAFLLLVNFGPKDPEGKPPASYLIGIAVLVVLLFAVGMVVAARSGAGPNSSGIQSQEINQVGLLNFSFNGFQS